MSFFACGKTLTAVGVRAAALGRPAPAAARPAVAQVMQSAGFKMPAERAGKRLAVPTAKPSLIPAGKNPKEAISDKLYEKYDPEGWRREIFSRRNKAAIKPGSSITVFSNEPATAPFSGTLIAIRRSGLDTNFVVRSEITRLGVEMRFALFSPKIKSIRLDGVPRKRVHKAKLYYLRDD
ncbi:mitochondrial 54S ribosomal protein bL19m [Dipodascopsis tothii]|uniref:mitochondrial 54S ribosomal protein bL19m n=1 Tax=Dipodascopsis tothii TaxID=44089 RepID=UPI0034CD0BF8